MIINYFGYLFPSLQRNHSLFGSVWSSLKRKKLTLSAKRGLSMGKKKKVVQINVYDDDRRSAREEEEKGDDDEEIGRVGGGEGKDCVSIGIDDSGDPVNSMTGELQTRVQQNIPMRPLVVISSSNNNNINKNYNMNVAQNMPNNE